MTILESDAIIAAAHSEEDISHLDIYVYEEDEDNVYTHHDILLSAFPLSLAWLDWHPSEPENKGN